MNIRQEYPKRVLLVFIVWVVIIILHSIFVKCYSQSITMTLDSIKINNQDIRCEYDSLAYLFILEVDEELMFTIWNNSSSHSTGIMTNIIMNEKDKSIRFTWNYWNSYDGVRGVAQVAIHIKRKTYICNMGYCKNIEECYNIVIIGRIK